MRSLSSGRCLCCKHDFARRLFDRGRLLGLIMRSTKFFIVTLDPCMIFLKGSKMIAEYSENVSLLFQNGDSLETCKLFGETLQQVHILCTILRHHITKEHKSGHAKEPLYQLLVGDISHILRNGTFKGSKKMETLSPISVMLLVCKQIIQKEYHCWFFSSQFGFTVLSPGLWSMGNDNDNALSATELQLGAPCCICFDILIWCLSWRKFLVIVGGIMVMLVLFKSGIYKGAIGVIHGTVQGKAVFDKGLNHWHKEVVGEIIGQLNHVVCGGDKEVKCRISWQSYDYVEVNKNDRALKMQLEVILFLSGSWNVGYGRWMMYKYSTNIKVSIPCSVQCHITRDTSLKIVVVHVLLFTIFHGFPVYRLHSEGCIVSLDGYRQSYSPKWLLLLNKLLAAIESWKILALQVMLLLVPYRQ
ncbi:hypothetical protein MKX03_023863 [Papaver bracteatum]|nr:hypothetical protein MKX03_023863 [Papaver bracteatum]